MNSDLDGELGCAWGLDRRVAKKMACGLRFLFKQSSLFQRHRDCCGHGDLEAQEPFNHVVAA